ncbi:MAG: hypothetical protein GWP14_07745 [Actinobacteria bacterium]|nr:hypothetical protein [Actinomycetota bacterium]
MRNVLVLSIVLALAASGNVVAQTGRPEYLSYEKFLERVRADEVKSLTIRPLQYLEGTYADGDQEKQFFTNRPLESGSDPLLSELLEKHQVKVVQEPPPEPNAMAQLAQYGPFIILLPLPSVLLVIVLVYLVRLSKKIDQMLSR